MKWFVLTALLLPSIALAVDMEKVSRRDQFVFACLNSMAAQLTIWRHEEVEDAAIQCAYRIMKKLDKIDNPNAYNGPAFPQGRQ